MRWPIGVRRDGPLATMARSLSHCPAVMSCLGQRLLLGALLFASAACSAPGGSGRPLSSTGVPPLHLTVDHFQGSPLSGPRLGVFAAYPAEPSAASPDESPWVRTEAWVVDGLPEDELSLLSSDARLIALPLEGDPLRPNVASVIRGRVGNVHDVGALLAASRRALALGAAEGALDIGMTSVLRVERYDRPGERIELLVSRPLTGLVLSAYLVLRSQRESGEDRVWEQILLAEAPAIGGDPLLLTLPLPEGGDLLLRLAVGQPEPGSAEHALLVAAARTQAAAHHAELLAALAERRAGVPANAGLVAALVGMQPGANRRGAVLYLATLAHAPVCTDVALSGRPELLDEVAEAVRAGLPPDQPPTAAQLAWLFESESLSRLSQLIEAGDDDPALEAMLLRHTGEVGRNLPLLQSLIGSAGGPVDLRQRLVAENLLFLEDNAPASRVRAFDWLLGLDRAPEGFDPLATRKERRAALARLREAASSQP